MKTYLAIKINDGVHILNNNDELGSLIDNDIKHEIIGEVCDNQKFGDNCANCKMLKKSICKFNQIKDVHGNKWHVVNYAIINNMDDETYNIFRTRFEKQ